MAYYNRTREIHRKVRVVEPIPGKNEVDKWKFKGDKIENWPETDSAKARNRNGAMYKANESHKVLYVKNADGDLDGNKFLITVPSHFFDTEGNFRATPLYSKDEVIIVKYTGDGTTGCAVEWIDININERGGGGDGGGTVEEIGCAKWS